MSGDKGNFTILAPVSPLRSSRSCSSASHLARPRLGIGGASTAIGAWGVPGGTRFALYSSPWNRRRRTTLPG